MAAAAEPLPPDQAGLRQLYDSSLGPYLAAQDAKVLATRRNRWLVLAIGLGAAAAILTWAIRSDTDNDLAPMAAFGLAVGAIALFFLMKDALADTVRDHVMAEIAPGRQAVTRVVPHPQIEWAGPAPDKETLDRMHHEAHDICFIANSVKTEVTVA